MASLTVSTLLKIALSFQPHVERSEKSASEGNQWIAKNGFLASLRNEVDEKDSSGLFNSTCQVSTSRLQFDRQSRQTPLGHTVSQPAGLQAFLAQQLYRFE